MQLVENLHRADLLPTEEASAYQRMSEELGYTHKEISLRVGRSEKHILRYLKLHSLPDDFKAKLDNGETTIQKALFLCSLPEKTAKEVLKDDQRFFNYTWRFEDFKNAILRNYIEDLGDNLPFKLDGKYGNLPKCTECPHKGSHPELFAEFVKEDKCPYAECFRKKEEIVEEAAEQKRKAKLKAQAAKQNTESDEDDDDEKEDYKNGNSDKYWDEQRAIKKVRLCWYLEKLIAKGINATDMFAHWISSSYLDNDNSEFYLKYLGKSVNELKQCGTYEEVLKAMVIDELCDSICYDDDEEVLAWLGCEQCPDEVLQQARSEAMGINK